MAVDKDMLVQTFVPEAADWLEQLDEMLLELEQHPEQQLIRRFMRVVHTLKGSAGVAGLDALVDLAHVLETAMAHLRNGRLHAGAELFDRLSLALDLMSKSLSGIAAGHGEGPQVVEGRKELEQWLLENGATAEPPGNVAVEQRAGLVIGEYDRIRLKVLGKQGKQFSVVSVPFDQEADAVTWAEDVVRALRKIGEVVVCTPDASEFERVAQAGALLVLLAADQAAAELGALVASRVAATAGVRPYEADRKPAVPTAVPQLSETLASDRTLRVELSEFDDLLRLVGELMISRDRYETIRAGIAENLDDPVLSAEIDASAAQLGRLTSSLQDAIMGARMVPVARMLRAIKRELCRRCREVGISVRLQTAGDATELDKNLVDSFAEPLAKFFAGLAAGAPSRSAPTPTRLVVNAARSWNQVVITVASPHTQTAEDDIDELHEHLALAGGRLEQLTADSGVAFAISLPLTLAITSVIMVSAGEEVYALPIETVREALRLSSEDIVSVEGRPAVDLRGEAVSLLFLRELFDVPGDETGYDEHVIVLDHKRGPVGLVVDRLIGIREVVIKPLSSRFSHLRMIDGSAVLGDEHIALILNAELLIEDAVLKAARRGPRAARTGARAESRGLSDGCPYTRRPNQPIYSQYRPTTDQKHD